MSTEGNTENMRDDNYTEEDLLNARALYSRLPGNPLEEILGMSVEEYSTKHKKRLVVVTEAEREAMAKRDKAQRVWLDTKPTSVENLAKFLARGIQVAAGHKYLNDDYEKEYFNDDYETEYTIGIRVDGFIDTLELATALVALGVIVINEDTTGN